MRQNITLLVFIPTFLILLSSPATATITPDNGSLPPTPLHPTISPAAAPTTISPRPAITPQNDSMTPPPRLHPTVSPAAAPTTTPLRPTGQPRPLTYLDAIIGPTLAHPTTTTNRSAVPRQHHRPTLAQPSFATILPHHRSAHPRLSYLEAFLGPPFAVGGSGGFDRVMLSEEAFPTLSRPTKTPRPGRAGVGGPMFPKGFGRKLTLKQFLSDEFYSTPPAPPAAFDFEADEAFPLPTVPRRTPRQGRLGDVGPMFPLGFGPKMTLKEFQEKSFTVTGN